jgi:hypothetical protein
MTNNIKFIEIKNLERKWEIEGLRTLLRPNIRS